MTSTDQPGAPRAYFLLVLNTILDRIQHRVTELIDEDNGTFEVGEWLAEFDLNEREYCKMVQCRAALIRTQATTVRAIDETAHTSPAEPLSPDEMCDVVENVLEIAEENSVALPTPLSDETPEAALAAYLKTKHA